MKVVGLRQPVEIVTRTEEHSNPAGSSQTALICALNNRTLVGSTSCDESRSIVSNTLPVVAASKIGRLCSSMCARMRDVSGCSEFSKNRDIWRQVIAEFIGTLILVLLGCASTIEGWNDQPSSQSLLQVALTFGITLAGVIQAIGHISGGHVNPAVTVSFLVTGKISIAKSLAYIVAQCLGAISGAALLQALTPADFHNALGVADLHPMLTPTQGFGVEFFATFTLVLVVFGVCDENRRDLKGSAPLIIGLYVTAAILAMGQYTGANMNPARSLGPAVIINKWNLHWVYWAGPIVGGIVAAHVYQKAFKARSPEDEQQANSVKDVRYQVVKIDEKDIINDRTSTI